MFAGQRRQLKRLHVEDRVQKEASTAAKEVDAESNAAAHILVLEQIMPLAQGLFGRQSVHLVPYATV